MALRFFFREPVLMAEEGCPDAQEVCAGDAGVVGDGGLPGEGIGGVWEGFKERHGFWICLWAAMRQDSAPGGFQFVTGVHAHRADQVALHAEVHRGPAGDVVE